MKLVEHLHQTARAGVVAGAERIDVALQLHRQPRAQAQDIEEGLVRAPRLEAADDRDVEPLLVHRPRFRPHAEATDIRDMRRVGEQSDDTATPENRGHHRQVMQVAGAEPWVVGDVVVALLHRLDRELLHEVPDAFAHGVDVPGRAGDGLRHHAALQVEDTRGEIARLPHGRAERGADHHLGLFFHHRDEAVPHHLPLDGGELPGQAHD